MSRTPILLSGYRPQRVARVTAIAEALADPIDRFFAGPRLGVDEVRDIIRRASFVPHSAKTTARVFVLDMDGASKKHRVGSCVRWKKSALRSSC